MRLRREIERRCEDFVVGGERERERERENENESVWPCGIENESMKL